MLLGVLPSVDNIHLKWEAVLRRQMLPKCIGKEDKASEQVLKWNHIFLHSELTEFKSRFLYCLFDLRKNFSFFISFEVDVLDNIEICAIIKESCEFFIVEGRNMIFQGKIWFEKHQGGLYEFESFYFMTKKKHCSFNFLQVIKEVF